ncbi:MAG: ATP-binding protein [Myxococcota bacterium]
MQSWWKRYLYSGFDPKEDNLLAWRGRALAVTCLATAAFSALLVLHHLRVDAWAMVAIFAVVAVASVLLPLLQHRSPNLERTGHAAVGFGFMGLVAAIAFRGGLSSPLPLTLSLMPALAAYLFRDSKNVLLWASLSMLALLGFGLAPTLLRIDLVDHMPPSERPWASFFAPVLALVLITLLSRTNARVQAEAIDAATAAERKRMEDQQVNQLQRAEQMALVGQLAVGVAHEVNNPLAYIGANIDFTAKRLRKDDERRWNEELAALQDASDGVHRISDIVNQLNAHGRKEEESIQPMRLRDSLELALRIARNQIRHRARVFRQYTDHPVVVADPGRLTQVFLNLLVNAAQAVPTGKRDQNEIRIELSVEGGEAVVDIRDTGHGIDPEVLARVTEPFFTTKDVGDGTGLGLSISDAIVRSYNGTMSLSSDVGRGTHVQVRLPLTEEDPITIQDDSHTGVPLPKAGNEPRLLLIDDDPTVRRGLIRLLPGTVIEAGYAREALEMLEDDMGFDIIICDVMMPDMTGIDFYQILVERHPSLCTKVLLVSGGIFEESARKFVIDHDIPMLTKPVRQQELMTLVDEMMGK